MRVRSKNNAAEIHLIWFLQISGFPETNHQEDRLISQTSSDMVDFIGGKPYSDQPVLHTRRTVVGPSYPPVMAVPFYLYPGTTITLRPPSGYGLDHGYDPGTPADIEADYIKFVQNAGERFTDRFRSNVSLANFIIELKDFKQLLHTITSSVGSGLFSTFRRILSKEGKSRLKSGPGSQFLDYTFNWKPLVEDTKKLLDSYQVMRKRLTFLIEQSSFQDHARIRFVVEPHTHGFNSVTIDNFGSLVGMDAGYTYTIMLVPDFCQVECNASAHIDNRIVKGSLVAWDALADQLGLNNGPKVLWNATKLSWLVDFFIDSHDFFKAFEVQAGQGALGISGGTASLKVKRQYNIVARYSVDGSGATTDVTLGQVLYRTYRRDLLAITPASLFSINTTLTPDQQLILGALAESQIGATERGWKVWTNIWKRNRHTFGRRWYHK